MLLANHVLFIDAEAIVIDKPSGLPVDPPRDGGLSVASHSVALSFGFARAPVPVHRLDRDTSGCLLLARNPRALKRFGQAFEDRRVAKTYLAVLDGIPGQQRGVIDLPLRKVSTREAGWRMVADKTGQAAVTRWEVMAEDDGRALVRFSPETGRTHQLRVHAASGLGHAIVGDPIYGVPGERMLLHASDLSIPRGNKSPIEAHAPLPGYFPGFTREESPER